MDYLYQRNRSIARELEATVVLRAEGHRLRRT